jgi:DHA1 family inner membrane transport protein
VLLVTAAVLLVGTSFFSYTSLYATYLHNQLGFSVSDAGTALGMYGVGALGGVIGGERIALDRDGDVVERLPSRS